MRYAELMLCESSRQTVRVFHGSPEHGFKLLPGPLYGAKDFGFAASYALERSHGDPAFVHTLDFHFQNLCDSAHLSDILDQHGEGVIPWAGVFIDYPEIMQLLTDAGYDGLTANDFGFRSDFEELPVWMVMNAAKQVTVVSVTEVTDDDLHRQH